MANEWLWNLGSDSFDFDPVISANLLVNTAREFLRKCCDRER